MAHKLFRDPLYDYIQIDKKHSWLLDLIDAPEVQRLRHISQLGMSHITYPGSNHSRFSHSLGVLHLMQRCVSHLKREYSKSFKQPDEEALLAAALLHDVGHAPFSHATEGIFGNHEERTLGVVNRQTSKAYKVLHKRGKTLPEKVAALIAKRSTAPLWQKSLISSQLDVDRLDYIRRDSLCSGAEYGNFDWFRILHTMELNEKKIEGRPPAIFVTWPSKSKFALEEYIFSRFYMYQSVYFHHTTRGFECLLRKILERARDLRRENKQFAKSVLPGITLLWGGSQDAEAFLNLTDHTLMAQIMIWQKDKDQTLSDLASRFLMRKGIGWAEAPAGLTPMEMHTRIRKVEDYLRSKGLNPRHYFMEDEAKAAPYRPYRSASASEEQSSVNSVILFDATWARSNQTGFVEISQVPDLRRIRAITDESSAVVRYYFPREHGERVKKLLK